jgi:hypothetical protein
MKLLDNLWEETYLKSLFNKLKSSSQNNKEYVETRTVEKTFNVYKKESNHSIM